MQPDNVWSAADSVIVSSAFSPAKVPEGQRISEGELVRAIAELGRQARHIPGVDQIVAFLVEELREGDRVVILSNGGFGGIHEKLLSALGARAAPSDPGTTRSRVI